MVERVLAHTVGLVNPESGTFEVFVAESTPPGWAAELITNDEVWADDTQASEVDGGGAGDGAAPGPTLPPDLPPPPVVVEAPPLHGRGSSRDAWAAHAAALGLELAEAADRAAIIAAVEAHES